MKQQLDLNEAYAVVTPADSAIEVLTLSDLQAQCRLDSVDEAELVKQHLAAAIDKLQRDTLLELRPTRLALKLDRFPCGARPIELNRCPVVGNVEITYFDTEGDEQSLIEDDDFYTDATSRPGRLSPVSGTSWPATERRPHAVTIEFDCGFDEGAVPATALQALRLLVGHWFVNREAAIDRRITEIAIAYGDLVQLLQWKA